MSAACNAPAHVKRAYAERLPPILARTYGRKKHYSRQEVTDSINRAGLSLDYACWALALFEAQHAFDLAHRAAGEVCDYAAMRSQMLQFVPAPSSEAWSLFDWDWIPWDIGDWFDWSP